MDFSVIEGLTDEELNEFYNDKVYTGSCVCNYDLSGRNRNALICFGWHQGKWYYYCAVHNVFGIAHCGYCEMQSVVGNDDACKDWCSRHGYNWFTYEENCICTKNGIHEASWSTCR